MAGFFFKNSRVAREQNLNTVALTRSTVGKSLQVEATELVRRPPARAYQQDQSHLPSFTYIHTHTHFGLV